MRVLFLAAAIMVLMSASVSAASQYEAEQYYNAARQFCSEKDWENCLRSIERAKEAYIELSDSRGISKCDNFFTEQFKDHTPEQVAQLYYFIATDYYLEAKKDQIDYYKRCLNLAQECDSRYQAIGGSIGTSGSLKCSELSKTCSSEIFRITASQKEVAGFYYEMAQTAYREKRYVDARDYVLNSSRIYNSIPDPTGVGKTAQLLTSIQNTIEDIRVNAAVSYSESLNYFARDNYNTAREYAIASQNLYSSIADAEGVQKSSLLLSQINTKIGLSKQERLDNARSLYIQAQEYYVLQRYANASMAANQAKLIYSEFLQEAREKEADLPEHRRVETMLYQGYIQDVNKLLAQITKDWGEGRMLEQAEFLYSKSQEAYSANQLETALAYARNALNMYTELGNYVGISKSNNLIATINTRIQRVVEVTAIQDSAEKYYQVADFENAYYEATRAKKIYQEIWMPDKATEIDNLITQINSGREKKARADQYYGTALGHFQAANYEQAKTNAVNAQTLYSQINYELGITESKRIVDESEKILYQEWVRFRNTMLIVGTVGIVIVFVLVSWKKKQQALEQEFQKRMEIEREHTRREKEEWSLEQESETKSRVEDELRKLVQEEREFENER